MLLTLSDILFDKLQDTGSVFSGCQDKFHSYHKSGIEQIKLSKAVFVSKNDQYLLLA